MLKIKKKVVNRWCQAKVTFVQASLQLFPNLKENKNNERKCSSMNIHSNIIYIYIYISTQKNFKQPNQLISNNIHTKKRASCEDYATL